VQSEKGKGTTAMAWFDTGNVDTPPVGDLPGMFRTILMFTGPEDMVIHRSRQVDGEEGDILSLEYEVRKSELIDALGDFEDAGALVLLDQYLRGLEDA